MKSKIYGVFLSFFLFASGILNAQTTVLSTGFTGYLGTAGTTPSGWYMSWHATGMGGSRYTSPTNYGVDTPSYKMGYNAGDSVRVISPPFTGVNAVSYWCKLNTGGAPTAFQSYLDVYESSDSVSWTLVSTADTLPIIGSVREHFLNPASTHVKFVYHKVAGNLAIDDIKLLHYVIGVPTASSYQVVNGCYGDSTHFSDNSSIFGANITGWSWDFGDSSAISNAQNPVHLYAYQGAHTVTLTINCDNSTTDDTTFTIFTHPKPVVSFTGSPLNGCPTLSVDFTNSSSISSGTLAPFGVWKFGTGDSATTPNVSYDYTTPGTYTVSYTAISNYLCRSTDSIVNMVTVNNAPVSDFTYSVTNGVATFTNSSSGASSSSWNFGDGSPASTTTSPSHTYIANGTYTVCLTSIGTSCNDSVCKTVNVVGLGVEPISAPEEITLSVSPNPSKGAITVDISGINGDNAVIKVFTIIGKEIENLDVNQLGQDIYHIDLSSQVEGFYFVRVYTSRQVYTWRVAISR